MSIAPNGKALYTMLEGALTNDPDQRRLRDSTSSTWTSRAYTGRQWHYRLESAWYTIGDLTAIRENLMLVIERDNLQGAARAVRDGSSWSISTSWARDGYLVKHQVADLMQLREPQNLGGRSRATLTFPFQTIESVIPLSQTPTSSASSTTTTIRSAAPECRDSPIPTSSSSSGWIDLCRIPLAETGEAGRDTRTLTSGERHGTRASPGVGMTTVRSEARLQHSLSRSPGCSKGTACSKP